MSQRPEWIVAVATGENDHRDPASRPGKPVAVALRYLPSEDAAPKVTASGRGSVAERIIEAAQQAGVPVHEDGDLAQVLAAVEIDSEIPLAAFSAVAEILICLYRANATLTPAPASSSNDPAQGEPR
jgi:Uncharacterized homolog of the cytoplasmic domain of flagellar protein FhlB